MSFMQQWVYVSDHDITVTTSFKQKARALGVDLDLRYVAIVVEGAKNQLPNSKLMFELDALRRVYVVSDKDMADFLKLLVKQNCHIGIGSLHFDLSGSIREALLALTLLNPDKDFKTVQYFSEVVMFQAVLMSNLVYPEVTRILVNQVDSDSFETLWLYLALGYSISALSDTMHIHRRTVQYRLDKITQLTGLNPHEPQCAMVLIIAAARIRFRNYAILIRELQSFSDQRLPRDKTV